METALCKLTLVLPSDAAERIAELMLSSVPAINGFTKWAAEGHGESFLTATGAERVRGRVTRTVFMTIMESARAKCLLAEIAETAPIPHMIYLIEPVTEFGRMAIEPANTAHSANSI